MSESHPMPQTAKMPPKVAGVKQIDAEKTARIPIKIIPQPALRKPEWIRMKMPDSARFQEIKQVLQNRQPFYAHFSKNKNIIFI